MKKHNYVPDTTWVLKDMTEAQKIDALCFHSEKLAYLCLNYCYYFIYYHLTIFTIAFGLISTPEGTDIYVDNNLRTCGDCHAATSIMYYNFILIFYKLF